MIVYAVMLQFSFIVLVLFSFFNRTVTKDSLTILFYGTGSIFQCGGFCMEDSYCIEFLYNAEKDPNVLEYMRNTVKGILI